MTYTDDDLTPWFPPDMKPVHEGMYQTNISPKFEPTFQYWNGKCWGYYSNSYSRAYEMRDYRSSNQRSQWRGLNKQP